jgi:hypothetical protein
MHVILAGSIAKTQTAREETRVMTLLPVGWGGRSLVGSMTIVGDIGRCGRNPLVWIGATKKVAISTPQRHSFQEISSCRKRYTILKLKLNIIWSPHNISRDVTIPRLTGFIINMRHKFRNYKPCRKHMYKLSRDHVTRSCFICGGLSPILGYRLTQPTQFHVPGRRRS